ncbi:MAG: aspartate/glutamate racemase family protein [Polaromonas sp.]|nr:MAG: aspartate/glutamate racemase family protein [Polaromonas sp.]
MRKPHIVGILGGMGPAAGADFARLFVNACAEHMRASGHVVSDQGFPEHWLAQVPVPDRSAALDSPDLGAHQPLEPMLQALGKLTALGATTVAMSCNTAHAWHSALQERFPHLELLHVAREVAANLARRGVREVGLLATAGTYRTGLYDQALRAAGVQCHVPQPHERDTLMRGIYQGVKADNVALAKASFTQVAESLSRRHGLSTLVLGCTEIPLALHGVPALDTLSLVDPAVLLAKALACRAYQA